MSLSPFDSFQSGFVTYLCRYLNVRGLWNDGKMTIGRKTEMI